MRVALWADNVVDPNMTGIGYHQAQFLQALDRLDDQHAYTAFYTSRKLSQEFPLTLQRIQTKMLPGLRHMYYPMWHMWNWPPLELFMKDYDIVHLLHSSVSVPTHVPTIIWIVDVASARIPDAYPKRRRIFKDRAIRRAVSNPKVWFTANSNFVKEELCDLYDVAPDRVYVVHLGVDRQQFQRVQREDVLARVRERYGLARPFFLFVGISSPRKNLEMLIRGISEFNRRTGQAYELVLAGPSGWQDEAVFQAAAESNFVRRTGYVSAADLPALYSLSRALIYPSSAEGFGLPLLEAMACGTPVVASNLTSIPEVVGDAGILLDEVSAEAIAAALEKVETDEQPRRTLIERGYARTAVFTWEAAALRCRAVYEKFVGSEA